MNIRFLAADSLGVRSMATYVEAGGYKVFIDPGVALGPWRYGLPPHPIELNAMNEAWGRIVEYAGKSDIIIITHYHFDHFNPKMDLDRVFGGKVLYMKDPDNNINPSQIRRSHFLLHRLEEEGVEVDINVCDGLEVDLGGLYIRFSKPVKHGHDTRLGYVVMVYFEYGGLGFLYSSDVESYIDEDVAQFIKELDPGLIYMDGPLTYLDESRIPQEVIDYSGFSLAGLVRSLDNVYKLVIDHHLLRDRDYRVWIDKYLFRVRESIDVVSVAEFMGVKINQLEAYRDILYSEYPVDSDG